MRYPTQPSGEASNANNGCGMVVKCETSAGLVWPVWPEVAYSAFAVLHMGMDIVHFIYMLLTGRIYIRDLTCVDNTIHGSW